MNNERDQDVTETPIAGKLTPWVQPEVVRIEAGSAEAGDFANPDGAINS